MGTSHLTYKRTEVARWTQGPPLIRLLRLLGQLEVSWGSGPVGGPSPVSCHVEAFPRCSANSAGSGVATWPRCLTSGRLAGRVLALSFL